LTSAKLMALPPGRYDLSCDAGAGDLHEIV